MRFEYETESILQQLNDTFQVPPPLPVDYAVRCGSCYLCCAKILVWVFLLVGIVGAVGFLRLAFRVKFVSVDERFLYVSSGSKEIQVPLAEVESVNQGGSSSEPGRIDIKYITLRLKAPSEFGEEVVFVPRMHWTLLPDPHPVVEELEAIVRSIREQEMN